MMTSILEVNNVKESKVWMKALSAKFDGKGTFEKEDWDELLGNCQVCCPPEPCLSRCVARNDDINHGVLSM